MKTLHEVKGEIRALQSVIRYATDKIRKLEDEEQQMLEEMREDGKR